MTPFNDAINHPTMRTTMQDETNQYQDEDEASYFGTEEDGIEDKDCLSFNDVISSVKGDDANYLGGGEVSKYRIFHRSGDMVAGIRFALGFMDIPDDENDKIHTAVTLVAKFRFEGFCPDDDLTFAYNSEAGGDHYSAVLQTPFAMTRITQYQLHIMLKEATQGIIDGIILCLEEARCKITEEGMQDYFEYAIGSLAPEVPEPKAVPVPLAFSWVKKTS